MAESTSMVVLANSAKFHGVCVAGRACGPASGYGPWIRPVVDRQAGGLPLPRTRCADGRMAGVLDVVALPLSTAAPLLHQRENHLLKEGVWRRVGKLGWGDLESLVDDDGVWLNGCSSTCGVNDRIPEIRLDATLGSLKLVRVENAKVYRTTDLYGRPKLRAAFKLGGIHYNLSVTDPLASSMLGGAQDLYLPVAFFCVSLALPFQGNAYKLVASVITPARSQGKA